MTIGERIKKNRQQKKLSQKELGKLLGVSQQMIGQWESPNANLTLDTIQKLATALEIDINELLGNDIFPFDPKLREKYVNFDNKERHHLLIHHYNEMGRIGRDSLLEILSNLKILNDAGQKEASKRVEELTEIPRYTQKGSKTPDKEE